MNFEELSKVWNETSESLEKQSGVNFEILKAYTTNKIRKSIAGIKYEAIFELVVTIWFANFLVRFISDTWENKPLAYGALFILIMTTASLSITFIKINHYFKIKPGNPVLKMQKALERLRAIERFEINLLYVLIPLFSLPFTAIFAKVFAGIDIFQYRLYLISNLAGSFIIALIIVYFLKKFPDKKLQNSLEFLDQIKEVREVRED